MKVKTPRPTPHKPQRHKPPNLKKAWLASMWYENEKGQRRAVTEHEMKTMTVPSVRKWPYAYSCFPNEVTTRLYRRRAKDGGYGSKDLIGEYHSTANDEGLVLSLLSKGFRLYEAIRVVSEACERCHNILAGIYKSSSKEAKRCNTSCDLCK